MLSGDFRLNKGKNVVVEAIRLRELGLLQQGRYHDLTGLTEVEKKYLFGQLDLLES